MESQDDLEKFFANVVSKPASGSTATTTSLNGTGDARRSPTITRRSQRGRTAGARLHRPADEVDRIETALSRHQSCARSRRGLPPFVDNDVGAADLLRRRRSPACAAGVVRTVPGANDPLSPSRPLEHLRVTADLGGPATTRYKEVFDKDNGRSSSRSRAVRATGPTRPLLAAGPPRSPWARVAGARPRPRFGRRGALLGLLVLLPSGPAVVVKGLGGGVRVLGRGQQPGCGGRDLGRRCSVRSPSA